MALATGRRLEGIRLHSDTSGLTVSVGRANGPGMILTLAAGYIAPAIVGVCGALLLASGHITALLWTSQLLLASLLLLVRNAFGIGAVVVSGAAIFLVSWYASAVLQAGFAYALVWFLLLAAVRPVFELGRSRARRRSFRSDADQLARLTGLSDGVWIGLFALANLSTLVTGIYLLTP